MIFQKQQNKHILGTCCGVHCLFLHSALLAVSLGEMNHMLQLFPYFSSALLLLSFATVRVIVYTRKTILYFSEFLLHTMHQLVQSPINSFCTVWKPDTESDCVELL